MLDNYPPGAANDPNAPYNQSNPEAKEIEVTVSITLSKTVKISVTDYIEEAPEFDGEFYCAGDIDFSECDLESAVKEQVYLPQEAYKYLPIGHKATKDLMDWEVDDFEVILE